MLNVPPALALVFGWLKLVANQEAPWSCDKRGQKAGTQAFATCVIADTSPAQHASDWSAHTCSARWVVSVRQARQRLRIGESPFASAQVADQAVDNLGTTFQPELKMPNLFFLKSMFAATSIALSVAVAANPLEIAGSSTVHKAIVEPVSAKAKEAGVEIKMLSVGTGKGMQMLFDGKVTVAAVSDTLQDAVNASKKAGATNVPANLKMVTVHTDKRVPIVHPDNKVTALSKEQMQAILTGKVSNWKDVGGSDAPIVVVVSAPGSGTRSVIEKLLGGAGFASSAKELRTTTAELDEVARDKGAIGYVGSGAAESAKGKVREVKGSEVSRPLGFVTVGDPSPEAKKLFDFLFAAETKKLFVD
jgi:phosphate transport system substrate-binding protein